MKRSSASGGRPSLALRVKNNNDSKPRTSLSSGSGSGLYGSRSSIGGRLSLTGGKRGIPRPSSVGLGAGQSKVSRRASAVSRYDHTKDHRKLNDKSYKEKSIRELVEFLVDNDYPHPISPKILHTPTTKDFTRIFEFLNSFIDANYKVGSKLEEEVPRILKQYGYPFPITKSAMFTVGSPHTWPTLLGALTWLRQEIQYALNTEMENVLFPPKDSSCEFDNVCQEKLLFDFCEETYSDFMKGTDDFEEHRRQFAKNMRKHSEGGDIEALSAENRRLSQELEALKDQPDEMISLKDRVSSMRLDIEKMMNFSRELYNKLQQGHRTEKNLDIESGATESELQSILNGNQKKQHIFETQEFSQADVQRVNMERQQLQRQITGVEKEIEGLDKNVWDEEINFGKFQEKVDAKCAQYNKAAQMLQLIPTTAAYAFGIDYEMKPTLHGTENDKVRNVIKPALTKIKSQCVEKVVEVQDQKFNEQDTLDQLAEMVHEKEEEVAQIDAQIKLVDDAVDGGKESFGHEYHKYQTQVDVLQEDVKVLRKQSSMTSAEAEKEFCQDKARFERCRKEHDPQVLKYRDFLQNVCTLVVDHKTVIQEHMDKVTQDFQERLMKAKQDIAGDSSGKKTFEESRK